jgi:anti-sigma regulatory factor (Ser/Thr protein kinase)
VVSIARLVIGALAATDPLFDDERSADLRLAVSEACTNAIQAERARTAAGGPAGSVRMRCVLHDGAIEVAVSDHAGGFDPDALVAHPEVTDPARLEHEGGLGIPIIRMLADELAFEPSDGGTRVVMRFGPRMPGGTVPVGG